MLKMAVDAGIPIIALNFRDVINADVTLAGIIGKPVKRYTSDAAKDTKPPTKQVYYWIMPDPTEGEQPKASFSLIYKAMMAAQSVLILINCQRVPPQAFQVGELSVPSELIRRFLMEALQNADVVDPIVPLLGGCTIKEVSEIIRLATSHQGDLTPKSILETRKKLFPGNRGLTLVDTAQSFYDPDEQLEEWADREAPFFLAAPHPDLIPRGVVFDGPTGTGKTSGAKWLASRFGVPLYRLDLGGTKVKWVGESEQNLLANLSLVDHEEPCMLLLDEIEKIYGGSSEGDAGTTSSMLSQVLWWLAEHRSKVLVIMTTNNFNKLPKELYRPGRIDRVMVFQGLGKQEAATFIEHVFAQFEKIIRTPEKKVIETMLKSVPLNGHDRYSQAALTTAVHVYIKETFS